MNKNEALKLALEALGNTWTEPKSEQYKVEKEAITAIKEALAQPWPDLTEQQRESYQRGHNDGVAHHKQAVKVAQPEQEIDWKDMYEKEKRRSAMWLAKYEAVAGPAPKAYPQTQPEQEPVDTLRQALEVIAVGDSKNPQQDACDSLIEAGLWEQGSQPDYRAVKTYHEGKPVCVSQPEQEPWCMKMNGCKTKCEDCPDEAAQPEQEPVGFVRNDGHAYWIHDSPPPGTDLYTTPPKREWVVLTLPDRESLRDRFNGWGYPAFLVDAISDILKEKNT